MSILCMLNNLRKKIWGKLGMKMLNIPAHHYTENAVTDNVGIGIGISLIPD